LKTEQKETHKYKKQFNELEDEMQATINSYKSIIEQFQSSDSNQMQQ